MLIVDAAYRALGLLTLTAATGAALLALPVLQQPEALAVAAAKPMTEQRPSRGGTPSEAGQPAARVVYADSRATVQGSASLEASSRVLSAGSQPAGVAPARQLALGGAAPSGGQGPDRPAIEQFTSLSGAASGQTASPLAGQAPSGTTPAAAGLLDLNTASIEDLYTLPGGRTIGRAIVRGRPYRSPEELIQKRVLNRAAFERIKTQVTVHR